MKNPCNALLVSLSLLFAIAPLGAQLDLPYRTPPPEILALADVAMPPQVMLNDAGDTAVLLYRDRYKSIAEVSQPELRLGGLRVHPVTYASSRLNSVANLGVLDVASGKSRDVGGLPGKSRLAYFAWSPDQDRMAFCRVGEKGLELWLLDIAAANAARLTDDSLNGALGRPFAWFRDGRALLCKSRPGDGQKLIDPAQVVPTGPTVSVNEGQKAQNMTYQDLLRNKTDEFNFEQIARSELRRVALDGSASPWREAAMYGDVEFSPDGRYVLVTEIGKPFSYIVPFGRFPFKTSVYDSRGKLVRLMLDAPLLEVLPKGAMAERSGMRQLSWRADKPATLFWLEALDQGDPEVKADFRDELFTVDAPFSGEKKSLLRMHNRFTGVLWGNARLAVVSDFWWNTRNTKTYLVDPARGSGARIIADRNSQDRYRDPGQFDTCLNSDGLDVLRVENGKLFLVGDGFSSEGVRPFLDSFDTRTLKTARLWQADGQGTYEEIVRVRDIAKGEIITRIQAKDRYPNLYLRRIGGGEPRPVTGFANPFAALAGVRKELITYKREDGVDLSATLYLPLGYASGKKYPMVMWAYPLEFKDAATAGQISVSPHEFVYPYYGSPVFWITRGYVVLDDASFPIVGAGKAEPNDTFIPQLVANARAAIDSVDKLGCIDRRRVAVGGHSYGAFMTANLLTHSDLFAAGIARSGAYNRSLTPFGFQSEERHFWEAQDVYLEMSPFMHADKMKTPLLLIHGAADNNPGTHTLQSERYFNALKGLGATVRLVLLPNESHGYAARESILHLLWEQDQWLEKYLKN
jgi:dipeptidyl aminopeptidase/acylaminoacyl peptidase